MQVVLIPPRLMPQNRQPNIQILQPMTKNRQPTAQTQRPVPKRRNWRRTGSPVRARQASSESFLKKFKFSLDNIFEGL